MFSLFFLGTLTAGWLHLGCSPGSASWPAACSRPATHAALTCCVVVTTPPLIFLVALICVKALTATGSALILHVPRARS